MREKHQPGIDGTVLAEIQVVLAEKRTALATLRAGIAVFALPLSVLSVLVATSKYYEVLRVLYFIVPLTLLNVGLIGLGTWLITSSIARVRRYDRMVKHLKERSGAIGEIIQ